MLDAIPVDPSQSTFVDLGAGMGRVVLLAAERGYRSIVGVEISPALLEVARANLRSAGDLASRIRLKRCDAACYRLPRGDLAVYLFNPFSSEVVAAVVRRLIAHESGDVAIAYHTPVERAVIEETHAFRIAADLGFGVVYRRVGNKRQ